MSNSSSPTSPPPGGSRASAGDVLNPTTTPVYNVKTKRFSFSAFLKPGTIPSSPLTTPSSHKDERHSTLTPPVMPQKIPEEPGSHIFDQLPPDDPYAIMEEIEREQATSACEARPYSSQGGPDACYCSDLEEGSLSQAEESCKEPSDSQLLDNYIRAINSRRKSLGPLGAAGLVSVAEQGTQIKSTFNWAGNNSFDNSPGNSNRNLSPAPGTRKISTDSDETTQVVSKHEEKGIRDSTVNWSPYCYHKKMRSPSLQIPGTSPVHILNKGQTTYFSALPDADYSCDITPPQRRRAPSAPPGLSFIQYYRVQEADGCFFENFMALQWKQENRQRRLLSEAEKEKDKPPPMEKDFTEAFVDNGLTNKALEKLYVEVLYTIQHKLGKAGPGKNVQPHDLYLFAQEAFGVTNEKHRALLSAASEEKPPVLVLNVEVLESRDLESKDANGFSDPYCMLGIIPGDRNVESEIVGVPAVPTSSSFSEKGDNTPTSAVAKASGSALDEDKEKEKEKEKGKIRGIKKLNFTTSLKKRHVNPSKEKKEKEINKNLIPAKYIHVTSVRHKTLNPIWNEKFRCVIQDITRDQLHLDIWDHDDDFSVSEAAKKLNQVQGIKGMGRYFKQIVQSARTSEGASIDDFLGCITLKLDNIPSQGIDRWYSLEGRTARSSIQGKIRLRLSLSTKEDNGTDIEEENWADLEQHEALIKIFIDSEISKLPEYIPPYMWNGNLPSRANIILHQHAIQGDITETQEAVCKWIAYSAKHLEYSLDYSLLLRLLQNLDYMSEDQNINKEEEESLAQSFTKFIDHSLLLLRKIHDVFPAFNKAACKRLETMLSCLDLIYKMKIFKICCPFAKDLPAEISTVLKKGIGEWYEITKENLGKMVDKEDDSLSNMLEILSLVNAEIYKSVICYDEIFKSIVNVNYLGLVYKHVERLITEDALKSIKEESVDYGDFSLEDYVKNENQYAESNAMARGELIDTTFFEIYLELQEFNKYSEYLSNSERKNMNINKYYLWFKTPILRWFTIAKQKVLKRVQKAVEIDTLSMADAKMMNSTSCLDVMYCFTQVKEFWRQLSWPDPVSSYMFLYKIVEVLYSGSICYVDLLNEKFNKLNIKEQDLSDVITIKVCVIMNDIEYLNKYLASVPEQLSFKECLYVIDKTYEERVCNNCGSGLNGQLEKCQDYLNTKIKIVSEKYAEKVKQINHKNVFHLSYSPSSVNIDDAIEPLVTYLNHTLTILNQNLLKYPLDISLECIFLGLIGELEETFDQNKDKPPSFFKRLQETLIIVRDFFHANDEGLPIKTIENKRYKLLFDQCVWYQMDTKKLIDLVYLKKMDEQMVNSSSQYGILTIKTYFDLGGSNLHLKVISAQNLAPLDTNGYSDPYIVIELVPRHLFKNITPQKTKVVKKTLNPFYDEEFTFNLNPKLCLHKTAMIQLTILDHDYMFQNDFAGECFLSLNDIPGLDGETIKNFSEILPIHLQLIKSQNYDKSPFMVLEYRAASDKVASEFVKTYQNRFKSKN